MNEHEKQAIEVALLKKDVAQVTKICDKLDNTIESIDKMVMNISTMIQLQEHKIGDHDDDIADIKQQCIDDFKTLKISIEKVDKKLRAVEKYIWIIIGGFVVINVVVNADKILQWF